MAGLEEEFYNNDIVYRFDKRKRIVFGVVTESYEASSDVDDFNNLEKGQIRVWWSMSPREQVWKQNKVRLMNRTIVPGDIVRRFVQGQDTQRGYCKYTKQFVSVQIVGTDKIVEKVCSSRLKPVSKYSFDRTVCLDNRYGRIRNVECKILMQAKCGSCVEISRCCTGEAVLDDYWLSRRNRWYTGTYYPGQEVVCIPQYFRDANWLFRSKNMKRRMQSKMRFTIQNVEVEAVTVIWFTTNDAPDKQKFDKSVIKGDDLKRLKILDNIDPQYFELSERMFLKLSSSDSIIKKQDWLRKQTAYYKPSVRKVGSRCSLYRSRYRRSSSISQVSAANQTTASDGEEWWTDEGAALSDNESTSSVPSPRNKHKRHWPPRPKEIVPGNTLPVEILCYESKITVVWQDGTVEEDIPSTQLSYSVSLDDHEFFPGEWVVAEGNQNGDEYGAVQSVDHLERTAKVKWFRIYDKNGTKSEPTCLHTSELSVYDLQKHQQYLFRPGSSVYSAKGDVNAQMGSVHDSYPEGYVHVQWIDGTDTRSWPQDLVPLPDIEYDILSETSSDFGPGSWETESIESIDNNVMEDTKLALMASKLDYTRNKMMHLKDMFKQHTIADNFAHMRDLLIMYDNSSYLDKLLGTSFFSRKSHHFRMLLEKVKVRAAEAGVELAGTLFTTNSHQNVKIKNAEKENMDTVNNIESALSAQITQSQSAESVTSTEPDPDSYTDVNLCVELASMIKARMDLAYAEIVSHIGGQEALMVMTKASENTPAPSVPNTPEEVLQQIGLPPPVKEITTGEGYVMLDEAPKSHHFYSTKIVPSNSMMFFKAIRREVKLLEESLPPGVWVRGYLDRIDLLSIMIRGPSKTPYEDGLFLFDLQLGADYPLSPPSVHYISFSSERLNPNLYVEGKVCVSLLGTWIGKGSEIWGPSSSLLQLIVSIQGLILVSEPYYNEAGYEKQVESQQGYENSRTYNELVILKLVQAMTVLLISPPEVFRSEILSHFTNHGKEFCERIEQWTAKDSPRCPEFPLQPVSKGFLLSLQCALSSFKEISSNIIDNYNKELEKREEKV